MKTIINTILLIFLFCNALPAQSEKKEIVLVGTMHWVPNIIKHAYKPMYRKAFKYQPQNIYVEFVPKTDTASVEYYYSEFSHSVDSLRNIMTINKDSISLIETKALHEMSKAEFTYLKKFHLLEKDLLHYRYYSFLEKNGITGSKTPTQNENGDVSFKLAAIIGLKSLTPMDYQISNKVYYKYWQACDSIYEAQERTHEYDKILKNINRREIIASPFIGNARLTNQAKTYESYHKVNSLLYFKDPAQVCIEGSKAWELRNDKMIEYIGEGVRNGHQVRNLVVVGAGHLYSLKKGLEERYPELIIKTLYK